MRRLPERRRPERGVPLRQEAQRFMAIGAVAKSTTEGAESDLRQAACILDFEAARLLRVSTPSNGACILDLALAREIRASENGDSRDAKGFPETGGGA